MTEKQIHQVRSALREFSDRYRADASTLSEQAHQPAGGQAGGGLSNAPLHLGDHGTEAFLVQMNATLLQNEEYLVNEVCDALKRLDNGTFGRCESCGEMIAEARLQVIPYARYCAACAAQEDAGPNTNLNAGRPPGVDRKMPDRESDAAQPGGPQSVSHDDSHAAGSAGGGTAVGGLAGSNAGDGSPDEAELEAATANGRFDSEEEGRSDAATPLAGHAGGAVGGFPAGKRVSPRRARRRTRTRRKAQ